MLTPAAKATVSGWTWSSSILPMMLPCCRWCSDNNCMSGHAQDWECMRCLGTCGAPTYLQGVTQGEWVPAECLSRSEKKAAFSFYSSLALYNGQIMQRKELNKKAVTCY